MGSCRLSIVWSAVAIAAGCVTSSQAKPPVFVPASSAARVDATLLLIGDAGEAQAGDPILGAIIELASGAPDRTTVVFLGDNVYPRGLPEPSNPARAIAEARLDAQIEVGRRSRARVVFVPGNHDWDHSGPAGWDAVRRQERFVEASGSAEFLPDAGCPGPELIDVGRTARVIVLDTQWWLHEGPKPWGSTSECVAKNESQVLAALRRFLESAEERRVVLVAHHPLETAGPHGGLFGWQDHLFPLRRVAPFLWIPLPVVGSVYPLIRRLGVSDQDLAGRRNERLRDSLRTVLDDSVPLVYASGHEHSLQVFAGESVRYLLVSGAGPSGGTTPVGWKSNTLFASDHRGFMRLDFLDDGRVRLGVLSEREQGVVSEAFSTWLTTN